MRLLVANMRPKGKSKKVQEFNDFCTFFLRIRKKSSNFAADLAKGHSLALSRKHL